MPSISAGGIEARFDPSAAMICHSLRFEGRELLGRRAGLEAWRERGKTMGIPLLHPFANRLAAERFELLGREVAMRPGPRHGFAWRAGIWTIDDRGPSHLDASLELAASPEFPFAHRIAQRAEIDGRTLRISTTVGSPTDPVPVSFGYHPYLTLPGVPRETWEISVDVSAHLPVDEDGIPSGEESPRAIEAGPLGTRTFDDLYRAPGHARFVLTGPQVRIETRFVEGYPFAQIFAPADDPVICFEPMTAPTNALISGRELPIAEPGESYAACFEITIST